MTWKTPPVAGLRSVRLARPTLPSIPARDIRFCEDMRGILYRWPAKPKQAAWIRGLVANLGGKFHE